MNPTSVLDTADLLLAIPVQQASGEALDFSGTALSIAFTPVFGGAPIATATSADGTLQFVPGLNPYFAVNLPVAARTWRVSSITTVIGDVLRRPDPLNPLLVEWLGREALRVHPGSNSAGIATAATSPVLIPTRPYDGRLAMSELVVGPQGASGAPLYQLAADHAGLLAVDISDGAYAKAALTSPAQLQLTGWPTDFEMGRLTLELDIAPGATLTGYPAGVIWSNGTAPALSIGPAKDVLMFTSIDGGATIFGHLIGQNYR